MMTADWRDARATSFETDAEVAAEALVALHRLEECYADNPKLVAAVRPMAALIRSARNERDQASAQLRAADRDAVPA